MMPNPMARRASAISPNNIPPSPMQTQGPPPGAPPQGGPPQGDPLHAPAPPAQDPKHPMDGAGDKSPGQLLATGISSLMEVDQMMAQAKGLPPDVAKGFHERVASLMSFVDQNLGKGPGAPPQAKPPMPAQAKPMPSHGPAGMPEMAAGARGPVKPVIGPA